MINYPHSYECALMSEYTYHFDEINAKKDLPPDWYIFRQLYRKAFLDARLVVFEKIISLDDPATSIGLATELSGVNKGKKILNFNVQQVYAFAGTYKRSYLNWIADFVIACQSVPSTALIAFMNDIPANQIMEGPTKTQVEKLTDNGKNIVKLLKLMALNTKLIGDRIITRPLYDPDLSEIEYPAKYKALLEKYVEDGYSIRRNVTKVTYTGHSLGALAAVPIASYMGAYKKQNAQAIVFESPGSAEMMDDSQKKWANRRSDLQYNVISYLAAPNLVNTRHKHVGKVIRLHVQHVPNDYRKWIEKFTSAVEDITRWYIIRFCTSSILPESQFEKHNFQLNIKNLGWLIGLNCVARGIWNIFWHFNQHSMKNLLSAFDINGTTVKIKNLPGTDNGKVMSSWPSFSQYQFGDRLRRIGFFISPSPILPILPFANSGIISKLFINKEEVSETQTQNTIGYK